MGNLKKIVKLLFSRMFLVALFVIIQVVISVYFLSIWQNQYIYFQVIATVISIIIFVTIVNKHTNLEQKIVWIFLMLIFPLLGTLLYLLFYLTSPRKKVAKRYMECDVKTSANAFNYKKEIEDISGEYLGQYKYLEKMSSLNTYKNTNCYYLKDGMEFYKELLKELKNAKKFIFMEYFIINEGAMWNSILDVLREKVKDGVEVKFIYDDLGSVNYVKGNYYRKLRSYGIQCVKFNPMMPLVSAYHNNRDHRKLTIIDGVIGFTGGINLSDEYINITHPYGYWKDNAIKLVGEAVNNLSILFLQNYGYASHKKMDFSKYLVKDNPLNIISDEIVFPYGTGPNTHYYENFSIDVFLNLINQAKKYIDISTPYLIIDNSMKNALIRAASKGVKIRILIPSKPDKKAIYAFTRSTAHELSLFGIEIYTFTPGFNHAKYILVDDEISIVGTTNFDFRSLLHHFECGVLIYNSSCIKDIDQNFEQDFANSKMMSSNELQTNVFLRVIISFLKVFQSLL
ncbi:MAG: cardiolipin synthase [Erysipelotrichaceae bacterium]|nr:cardiolipin synthase [Erysipelotrichaceae bacterium]